jgi:hypothetical protein
MNLPVTGVVQGGWEFVTAAYVITAVILVSYVVSVFIRYRAETARRDRESGRERASEVIR